MTYTVAGDLATLTEPAGASYTLTWDDARRLTKIQNNLGETITYTRDAMGNETGRTITAADGTTQMFSQTNTFDELGRRIKQVGGEGRTWAFGYDKTSNLVSVTDPRSKVTNFGFDAVNRLISETERDGGIVKHAYNGRNEETTYTDPRSLASTYVRNGFGDVIQETSPDRGTTVFDYDARGLMISKKDARGITVTYSYDNAGRLTGRTYPTAALNETFTYDETAGGATGTGRLTTMKDAAGTSSYYYDAVGRLTGEVRAIGTYSHTVAYTYDATGTGKLISMTYPSGRIVIYGYDALGRVNYVGTKANTSATEQQILTWIGYFPFGGLRGITFANGLNMFSNDDLEYRLDGLFLDQASGGPSLITRYHYIGDQLNITKLNNDSIDPTQSQTFTYDDAGRLLTAAGPYGSRTYTYDKVGNRLSEAKTVSGTSTSQSYTYPTTSNKLSTIKQGSTTTRSFIYDAAGTITSDTRSGTAYTYTINDAGRISQVKVGGTVKANYTYDGRNRLSIRQTLNATPSGTQHLIHDAWDHVIVETNGAGQAVREYIWVGDVPVAVLDGSSTPTAPTLLWVHVDHLGRPELMTDATKAVKWKAVYEPFGTVSSITGAAALQMRFPGQWFQLEAGLAYNWNRHYDSTIGRYTQTDTLGLNQGPALVDLNSSEMPTGIQIPAASLSIGNIMNIFYNFSVVGTNQEGLILGIGNLTIAQQAAVDSYSVASSSIHTASMKQENFIKRDGPNLYGYAKQTPIIHTDARGLLSGPMSLIKGKDSQNCNLGSDCDLVGSIGNSCVYICKESNNNMLTIPKNDDSCPPFIFENRPDATPFGIMRR